MYGLKVEAVRTVNYEGKRKRRKQGFFRESDYKKVNTHCLLVHVAPGTMQTRPNQNVIALAWQSQG